MLVRRCYIEVNKKDGSHNFKENIHNSFSTFWPTLTLNYFISFSLVKVLCIKIDSSLGVYYYFVGVCVENLNISKNKCSRVTSKDCWYWRKSEFNKLSQLSIWYSLIIRVHFMLNLTRKRYLMRTYLCMSIFNFEMMTNNSYISLALVMLSYVAPKNMIRPYAKVCAI